MKYGILTGIILSGCVHSFAGTFVSNTVSGSYNVSTSWAFSGDADGIPDADDDVTILSGHQINLVNSGHICRNLSVAGKLNSTNLSFSLTIYGDYNNTGQEVGTGTLLFRKAGGTISGGGSYSPGMAWQFGESTVISNSVTVTKNVKCRLRWGITVTNNGNFTLNSSGQIVGDSPTSTWLNGTTGVLTLKTSNFMLTGVRNFTTSGNTLVLAYNNTLFFAVSDIFGNLTIQSGTTTLPTNITCLNNITTLGSSTLNVGSHNIHLLGNLNLSTTSTYNHTSGTLFMEGSTAQTANSGIITLPNITVDNSSGVTWMSGTVNLTDMLTITSGNFAVNGTTIFNLVSNVTQTAVIAQSSGSISVAATFNAQRFIASRSAGYSDMAGCMQGQTMADWDDELLMVFTYSPPNYYPSAWSYDETIWDYVPVTSSSTALTPGKGFEVYLDSDGSQTTFNSTTVINTGTPNMGTIDISSTITDNNDGWNLIGNPYHANISWDALHATTSNISPDIMFYDETIQDFTTVSAGSGELIAPEQGFWVQATSTSPSLAFTEAIKSTSLSSTFRSTSAPMFTLRLKSIGGTKFTSGTSFRFASSPELAEKGDLPFKRLPHPLAPALCSVSEQGKGLKINLINSSLDEVTVPLHYTVGQDGLYTIEAQNLESFNFENYTCALLTDNKTHRTVNLVEENYQFYAETGDSQNRFSLKLVKNGGCNANPEVVAANSIIDINRQFDNTVVKLNFAEPTFAKITITDLLGQEIAPAQSLITTQQNVYLTLPDQFSGIYLVNVFYDNQVKSKKLFK